MNINLVDDMFYPSRIGWKGMQNVLRATHVQSGIDQTLTLVSGQREKISILRFYGHGLGGLQIFGANDNPNPARNMSISFNNPAKGFRGGTQLLRLRGHFASQGRIELRGCLIASDSNGLELMWLISELLHVTVRAASWKQGANVHHWRGPVFEIRPGQARPKEVPISDTAD